MKLVHGDAVEWRRGLEYRGGTFHFRNLAEGEEGSVDNFKLTVGRSSADFYSPRHRHNFEQIRFVLDGELSFGRDGTLSAGMVGYFPEGVHYGPQTQHHESLAIVLQCGGASGSGYPSRNEVKAAMDALEAFGKFEEGVFRRREGVPGKKNMDGFQAIWEHINKRKLTYPKPRYEEPICMKPAGFEWVPTGQQGVAKKLLGAFSERGCTISMLKFEPGASGRIAPHGACQILFVVDGEGRAATDTIRKYTALSFEPGEACEMASAGGMELLLVALPLISITDRVAA